MYSSIFKEGKSLCKNIGLKYQLDHKDGHSEVYYGTVTELLNRPFERL